VAEARSVEVRAATGADIPFLRSLSAIVQLQHAEALPHLFKRPSDDLYTAEFFQRLLADPDSCLLVAWREREPVGFLRGQVLREPETVVRHAWERLHFKYIAVLPGARGAGCGRALIQAGVRYARQHGLATITGDVWSFNTRMRAFLAKEQHTVYCENQWLDVNAYALDDESSV